MPRKDPPRLRLFTAIYPPEAVAQSLLEAMKALAELETASYRPVPLEQVHLTVQFLGPTSVKDLDTVGESIERSCSGIGPFTLTPQRLITLPERKAPRLIAAETDAPPQVMELKRRLALRLARSPRERPADKFRPHLTLCRFREGSPRVERVDAAIESEPFAVTELRLMKSLTLPQGVEHEPVRVFPLEA